MDFSNFVKINKIINIMSKVNFITQKSKLFNLIYKRGEQNTKLDRIHIYTFFLSLKDGVKKSHL